MLVFKHGSQIEGFLGQGEDLITYIKNLIDQIKLSSNNSTFSFHQTFNVLVEKISSWLNANQMSMELEMKFFNRAQEQGMISNEELQNLSKLAHTEIEIKNKLSVSIFSLNDTIPVLYEITALIQGQNEMMTKLSQVEASIINEIINLKGDRQKEIVELQQKEQTQNKLIEALQTDIMQKDALYSQLSEQLAVINNQKHDLEKHNQATISELKKAKEKEVELSVSKELAQLQKLKTTIKELELNLEETKKAHDELLSQKIKLNQRVNNLQEEIKEKTSLISKLSEDLSDVTHAREEAEATLESLRQRLEEVEVSKLC